MKQYGISLVLLAFYGCNSKKVVTVFESDASVIDATDAPLRQDTLVPGNVVCTQEQVWPTVSMANGDQPPEIALGGGKDFMLGWTSKTLGTTDLYASRVGSDVEGIPGNFVRVTQTSAANEQHPSIVANGQQWLLAYFSNRTNNYETYVQAFDADLDRLGGAALITRSEEARDDNPFLALSGSNVIMLWVSQTFANGRIASLQPLSPFGARIGSPSVVTNMGDQVSDAHLVNVSFGYAMLWVGRGEDMQNHILMQSINDTANGWIPFGNKTNVSQEGYANGEFDVVMPTTAFPMTGGAVVYGVTLPGGRKEIRFRRMQNDGVFPESEVVITESPIQGSGPSVVSFGGGYAIGYRHEAEDGRKSIRVSAVDEMGVVFQSFDILPTETMEGQVQLASTANGQLGVMWVEPNTAQSYNIRFARIGCRAQ